MCTKYIVSKRSEAAHFAPRGTIAILRLLLTFHDVRWLIGQLRRPLDNGLQLLLVRHSTERFDVLECLAHQLTRQLSLLPTRMHDTPGTITCHDSDDSTTFFFRILEVTRRPPRLILVKLRKGQGKSTAMKIIMDKGEMKVLHCPLP